VGSTHDYARFCQMMLNKGEIGGKRILKPETVKLMTENHIGGLTVSVDGTRPQAGAEAVRFGLDFAVTLIRRRRGFPTGPEPTIGAALPAPGSGSIR
jgi:CubicO group peptidase (beta-lactamase class C family)